MISYAQNLEDVVLNRIFQNKRSGFYIDVGAHDPVELSVTKHFYDLGWRGINIEPVSASFEKFKKQRPEDINLNIAVGSKHDFATVFEIDGHPELTTLDKDIGKSTARLMGSTIKPHTIEVRTLAEICEQCCEYFIDFIKIDVEGFEKNVIEGANWNKFRPTMLVVEATIPNSGSITNWEHWDENAAWCDWEPLLFKVDYMLTYYDGLNRYYLRKEDEHLKNRFAIPVTWLQDQFSLYRDVRQTWRLESEIKRLEEEKAALVKERSELLKERDQIKNRNSNLMSEIETLSMERVRLVEENSAQQALISDFKEQQEELQKKQAELVSETEGHRERQAELHKKLERLLTDKKSLQDQFDSVNKDYKYLFSENEKLKSELGDKHGKLNVLKSALQEQRLIRQRNPLHRFLTPLKLLFRIKGSYDDRLAEQNAGPVETTLSNSEAGEAPLFPGSEDNTEPDVQVIKSKFRGHTTIKQVAAVDEKETVLSFPAVPEMSEALGEIHLELSRSAVNFVPCIDTYVPVAGMSCDQPWFGVVHTPEGPLPKWWAEAAGRMFVSNHSLLMSSAWQRSRKTCRGLIAFSESHAENLRIMTEVPVKPVSHPLPEAETKWSPQTFKENTKKKIIQWGWWMRRIHAIHMLWECPLTRVFIQNFNQTAKNIFNTERNVLAKKNLFFDFMGEGVETVSHLERPRRLEMLQGNIAFAHYYAASAPDAVLECIATHTPILVNALPSIIEYLGEDYPLYYHFYADAVEKALDDDLVCQAHEHLKHISAKTELSVEHCKQEITAFCHLKDKI